AVARAALQGRRANHRRGRDRHPGHARRAARTPDPLAALSGALGREERADRSGEQQLMAVETLRAEVTELLQELIRVDTVNPPGNETAAAELLREYLESNGVQCELYAKVPGRANLVARIPGSGDGPRLALLSHTDTVLADASEWDRDPWSGDVHEG